MSVWCPVRREKAKMPRALSSTKNRSLQGLRRLAGSDLQGIVPRKEFGGAPLARAAPSLWAQTHKESFLPPFTPSGAGGRRRLAAHGREPLPPAVTAPSRTALLVGGDLMARARLDEAAAAAGYTLTTATAGALAGALQGSEPDLVVLDLDAG